jgi:hypothetical protein
MELERHFGHAVFVEAQPRNAGEPRIEHLSAYVSICQHMSAYVSICQQMSAYVSIRQHTSAYVSIRQHTSAYVSMPDLGNNVMISSGSMSSSMSERSKILDFHARSARRRNSNTCQHTSAYVGIRRHTSAYVSIRRRSSTSMRGPLAEGTLTPVSIRQHTSAYVSIRQHTRERSKILVFHARSAR